MVQDKKIRNLIKAITDKIVAAYQPKKIILFGSYAYGEPTEDSDIDFLIVKNTDKRPIDRWMEIKKCLRETARSFPVSPLVYTEAEIQERMAIKDFFIEEILQKGEVVYG